LAGTTEILTRSEACFVGDGDQRAELFQHGCDGVGMGMDFCSARRPLSSTPRGSAGSLRCAASVLALSVPRRRTISALTNPRSRSAVVLWGTGLGPVTFPDNVAPTVGNVATPVSVTIGGQPGTVTYSGRSPCCSGVDQIIVTLPTSQSCAFSCVLSKFTDHTPDLHRSVQRIMRVNDLLVQV